MLETNGAPTTLPYRGRTGISLHNCQLKPLTATDMFLVGFDIGELNVRSLEGKSVGTTAQQNINDIDGFRFVN